MYIKNIYIENMGAIERFKLTHSQLFTSNNIPKPIILVGKNGSGKTTLLSSIVDALYELSNDCFSDVLPKSGMGYKYFKLSGSRNIRVHNDFAFSYVNFSKKEGFYEYLDKNGNISIEEIKLKFNCLNILHDIPNTDKNFKYASKTNEDIDFKNDFLINSYCYFPSDRYELPYWINKETIESSEQFSENSTFSGYLDRNILVRKSLNIIKNWILDVFLDSKVSIYESENKLHIKDSENVSNAIALSQSIRNIEEIISNIVQRKISIQLNYRGIGQSRIKLFDLENQSEFVPSLDNLSAGQSTLLGIFCTIIQYSDRTNLSKSIHLQDIEGIVIIDEVDLHLHIELQHDVLPNLIKLFPKVQFIITTHSPFFLAGISKTFDKDDILILNMPDGIEIQSIEDFSEFTKAYHLFSNVTNDYKTELDKLKETIQSSNKPLILTEGKTDWKHLKSAKRSLENYNDLDIDFLEYEDNVKMGYDPLSKMIESIKNIPNNRKIIAIFDRDEDSILNKYGEEPFKYLGNNVYAFCIPKVSNDLDQISIEYYYSEENLKTPDKQGRRLFFGSEFHKSGNSIDNGYQTKEKNKAGKKAIIDSNVFCDTDRAQENSVALSKNNFAENILNEEEGFQDFDFSNFDKIFNVIRMITEHSETP
jgi:hypothetical protein